MKILGQPWHVGMGVGSFLLALGFVTTPSWAIGGNNQVPPAPPTCPNGGNFLTADVVAIDHPMVFNRLGAQNVNWMMYALRHDVVEYTLDKRGNVKGFDFFSYSDKGNRKFNQLRHKVRKGIRRGNQNSKNLTIALRPDLRPRPLVLRVAAGDCLEVRFTNLLEWIDYSKAMKIKLKEKGRGNPNNADLKKFPPTHPTAAASAGKMSPPPGSLEPWKKDDQVFSRLAGFHPQGLELLGSIDSDSSNVGKNQDKSTSNEAVNSVHPRDKYRFSHAGSLAEPGETRTYYYYAPHEGAFLVSNPGAVFGGEGTSGNSGVGLFGAVAVQPKGARFYRSQITEEEMRLATRKNPDGSSKFTKLSQPIIDYEALYPGEKLDSRQKCSENDVWCQEGKSGLPILHMVKSMKEEVQTESQKGKAPTKTRILRRIVHSDINAIILGPNSDGSFPQSTYPIESLSDEISPTLVSHHKNGNLPENSVMRNPTLPNRLEPFREFVSVFHDENAATQAFPYFFEHPELGHTLHGVRDAFMINYGSGGIGSEIIANRLKAGPMQDCLDCAYEEFFLSSFVVGDSAMLVDKPTNLSVGQCQPEFLPDPHELELGDWEYSDKFKKFQEVCVQKDRDKATKAYYPHDPSNVSHSYIGDFVKFRNVHSGKEQHIFHLHNHQWLFNPNDDNSNYIDAQGIGPGSGYTYEIAFGGSGNRNKTVGDAIFHCHFYPHFAQGMWYMWRIHDVFESGTLLAVSDNANGTKFHQKPFGLMDGKPAEKGRALPDGEIAAGTPIPAIVPLPGKAMPVIPRKVIVKERVESQKILGSVAEVQAISVAEHNQKNPGYPFWVAGVSELKGNDTVKAAMGSRPTTPPLDMIDPKVKDLKNLHQQERDETKQFQDMYDDFNGGLPRHALAGYSQHGYDKSELTRLTAEKHIKKAKPVFFPETGTVLEQEAMNFHTQKNHSSYAIGLDGEVRSAQFRTNGASATPGAPYNDPCIDDKGIPLLEGGQGMFFSGYYDGFFSSANDLPNGIEFGGDHPRVYKGVNLQLDVVFNKIGYHYPQQRILALWEDVPTLLGGIKPPEPLVMRLNTYDCAVYHHTNLVPKEFYLDDYQITTPTDVIGQHIHLPKWDLTSADGGANGWNYEDGTFSPGAIRERIWAINSWNQEHGDQWKLWKQGPAPQAHPYFGHPEKYEELIGYQESEEKCLEEWNKAPSLKEFEKQWGIPGKCDWFGARTTLQRWFSDPIINAGGMHRGLGTTFTHDHLGPSTHQQLGLYATMLTEPPKSVWKHNETGELLYDVAKRGDGGPTSWQAVIVGKDENGGVLDINDATRDDSHREFFLQFGDFQHAYEKDVYVGVDNMGRFIEEEEGNKKVFVKITKKIGTDRSFNDGFGKETLPITESFRYAINPSERKPASPEIFPDIIEFRSSCHVGKGIEGAVYDFSKDPPARPCPESISADDVGMMVVNYRNEPIAARIFDPSTKTQTTGFAGDLAFALQTRNDRAIEELNNLTGPYLHSLTEEVFWGDPFTPIMRVFSGDHVKIKVQGGAHEHEHNGSINGITWLQGGSGFGQAPHSGWRNSQNTGLSEQFTFTTGITDFGNSYHTDRLYTVDSSQDGMWNGVWGILRSSSHLHSENHPHVENAHARDFTKLESLPSNPIPTILSLESRTGVCPVDANLISYDVVAVLAKDVLKNEGRTLVYNPRLDEILIQDHSGKTLEKFSGPLHDPTAILFVLKEDLNPDVTLKSEHPLEPLILRAAAGDCIQIHLHNQLPKNREEMPDLNGYTSLSAILTMPPEDEKQKERVTSFNNNHIRSSNRIGLHPQMVQYDVHASDGNNVGINSISTVAPGGMKTYQWYAGKIENNILPVEARCYKDEEHANSTFKLLDKVAKRPDWRSLSDAIESLSEQEFIIQANRLMANLSQERLESEKNLKPKSSLKGLEEFHLTKKSELIREMQQMGLFRASQNTLSSDSMDSGGKREFQKTLNMESMDSGGGSIHQYSNYKEIMNRRISYEHKVKEYIEKVKGLLIESYGLAENVPDLAGKIMRLLYADPEGIDPEHPRPYKWREERRSNLHGSTVYSHRSTRVVDLQKEECQDRVRFVGVEFGGSSLTPPDRIKQGQKGSVGALVVEPEGATWSVELKDLDEVVDRQDPLKTRHTRTTTTVIYPSKNVHGEIENREFREMVLVHQKGLNLRWGDGSAVQSLAAEKENANDLESAPEDAHDAGQMAINYGTEPMWFRARLLPDSHFGNEGFGKVAAWQAFSNSHPSVAHVDQVPLIIAGDITTDNSSVLIAKYTGGEASPIFAHPKTTDPYVPIMKVQAGSEMRLRALLPTGIGRATSFSLHGHNWARDPYLAEHTDDGFPKGNRPSEWGVGSKCIGDNPMQFAMGGQESLTPMAHFDVVIPSAGGTKAVPGDYLWQDHGGFGITSGLWSIVRVLGNENSEEDSGFVPKSLRSNCDLS